MSRSDKIEKSLTVRAPLERVWSAITEVKKFSAWFGIDLDGTFVVGKTICGTFSRPFDEAALYQLQTKLGLRPSKIRVLESPFEFCTVECIQAMDYFSFRWIPYALDAEVDLKNEPTTLVQFHLKEISDGTALRIVESGFDSVPAHRRERALCMNEEGWAAQARNIKRYVEEQE